MQKLQQLLQRKGKLLEQLRQVRADIRVARRREQEKEREKAYLLLRERGVRFSDLEKLLAKKDHVQDE